MSVTFSTESDTKPSQAVKPNTTAFLGLSIPLASSDSDDLILDMPAALPQQQQQQQQQQQHAVSAADAATLLSQAEALIAKAAAESDQESPRQASAAHTDPRTPVAGAGSCGTPTSTRSGRKPAVLSLSLQSADIDEAAQPAASAPSQANKDNSHDVAAVSEVQPSSSASPPATATPPPPSPQPNSEAKPISPRPPPEMTSATSAAAPAKPVVRRIGSQTPSESRKTPAKCAKHTAAATAAPSVPMLQLPIKACKDEVTPVKTLYSRLFHEAQQREQRQAQAQRKQRAAQKAAEKQRCTFHPRGAEDFGKSPAKQTKAKNSTGAEGLPQHHDDNSVSATTESFASAAVAAPATRTPRTPAAVAGKATEKRNNSNESHTSPAALSEEETAACERLYHNAEQNARRERRLQELREAQEEEFRLACTFHPSLRPASASRPRSESRGRATSAEAAHDSSLDELDGKRGASLNRSGTSPRGAPARSWEHFLADQEERQATQERHLAELKKQAEEQAHAKLFTGVPRSKASEHLKAYLEKKKGYKGPIEGWSERFEHYMKVKQAAEAELSTRSAANKKNAAAHTPASGRSRSRTRGESAGTAANSTSPSAGRSASVFHRLYHDSDEREAMRELIRLMKEQHEQTVFFKPNAGDTVANNGSTTAAARTPRRSQLSPAHADAAQETAAAVAVAAGEGAAADGAPAADADNQHDANNTSAESGHNATTAQSIFDTLFAEKEKLQRRREMRHLQAQNSAEVYSFHPRLSPHSRVLAKDLARQKARGEHVETVRERRAREAATAAAQEAARRAQIQFRYDTFAHRQAERDKKREDELLHVLLRERVDDVEACRFRPAISEVTEAIVDGNKNYTQVIDDPETLHSLMASRVSPSPAATPSASKSAGRAHSTAVHGSRSAARQSVATSPQRSATDAVTAPAAATAEHEHSIRSTHARPVLTPVQALAAGAEEAEQSLEAGTSQFYDVFSAPVNTYSATSSNSSEAGFRRTEHQGKTHSQLPAEVSFSSAKESVSQGPAKRVDAESDLDTVHIAGAASSEYLRQLESELQDALKDWSQCI